MIAYPKVELSEDQWDKIIGKYTETEVPTEEIPALWAKLRDLEPIDDGYSTHVVNAVFLLDDVRYNCYWALSDYDYDKVGSIYIQTPRPKMVKYPTVQLELFPKEIPNDE